MHRDPDRPDVGNITHLSLLAEKAGDFKGKIRISQSFSGFLLRFPPGRR